MISTKRSISFLFCALTLGSLSLVGACDKDDDKKADADGSDGAADGSDGAEDGSDGAADGSDGADGGDDPTDLNERVRTKLIECETISEGELNLDLQAGEECHTTCLEAASCDDVSTFFCSEEPDFTTALGGCILRCGEPASEPFACADGSQVDLSDTCDGFRDCADGSDEVDCEEFTCEDGEKIPAAYECDLEPDCEDGSDEHARCAAPQCG